MKRLTCLLALALGLAVAPAAAQTPGCFVLPGSLEGVTRSYRVSPTGAPHPVGAVGASDLHMRAAFPPDGRRVYVTTLVRTDTTPHFAIYVRTYRYDPFTCAIGPFLGLTKSATDTASKPRVYGLEVSPDGRSLYQTTASGRTIQLGGRQAPGSGRALRCHPGWHRPLRAGSPPGMGPERPHPLQQLQQRWRRTGFGPGA